MGSEERGPGLILAVILLVAVLVAFFMLKSAFAPRRRR